ncbi:MAG: outer membrane beta-barrel protein [Magnetococcus sp. YQC-3]
MNKIAVCAGILLPICIAGTALTEEKPTPNRAYVSLKIGGSVPTTDSYSQSGVKVSVDNAVNVSAAFGMRLQPSVRLELEGSYRNFDFNGNASVAGISLKATGDLSVRALMGNAYYDFSVDGPLKPYIVGGIGVARGDIEGSVIAPGLNVAVKAYSTKLAYQLGAGLSYDLSETVAADVGYHYANVDQLDSDGIHEFLAGLRFGF